MSMLETVRKVLGRPVSPPADVLDAWEQAQADQYARDLNLHLPTAERSELARKASVGAPAGAWTPPGLRQLA